MDKKIHVLKNCGLCIFIVLLIVWVQSCDFRGWSFPQVEDYSDNSSETDWTGRGFYYGIWFDDEGSYIDWKERHEWDHHHTCPHAHDN